eukprot:Ihof_evm12s66 gene=Ihof_evmTU12s66
MAGQAGRFVLTVIEGRDLKAMDAGNSSDPYVKIYINGKNVGKTTTQKKTLSPQWNQEFSIDVEDLDMIKLHVFDWDMVGTDDDMGTATIQTPLKELDIVDAWTPVSTRGDIHYKYKFTPSDMLGDSRAASALDLGSSGETVDTTEEPSLDAEFFHGYGYGDVSLAYLTGGGRAAVTPKVKVQAAELATKYGLWPFITYCLFIMIVFVMGRWGVCSILAMLFALGMSYVADTYMQRAVTDETRPYLDEFDSKYYPETESSEWINGIMEQIVLNYAITIEEEVVKNAQKACDDIKIPGTTLVFKAFAPGSEMPHLFDWHIHRGADKDLVIDCKVDWAGDFRVVIEANQAVGGMKLVIQDLNLKCKLRIFARLLKDKEPFLSYLWVQMPEKPKLSIDIQGLGADLPGMISLIKSKIVDTVRDMMVYPNRLEIDVAGPKGVK